MEQGLHQGCVLVPLLFSIFFAEVTNNRGLHAFRGGQRHHHVMSWTLSCIWGREDKGGEEVKVEGNQRRATVLATSLWGMLYAYNIGVVLAIARAAEEDDRGGVIVCAAFGLAVSEAKTEIVHLRTKGMPESTTMLFGVEAAGQVHNQTNKFVYLGGNVNHSADLSIEVNRRKRNAWCSFRKYNPRTARPTEGSPGPQNRDAKSRGTRDNAV